MKGRRKLTALKDKVLRDENQIICAGNETKKWILRQDWDSAASVKKAVSDITSSEAKGNLITEALAYQIDRNPGDREIAAAEAGV